MLTCALNIDQFSGAAIYGASKAALNDLCKSLGALYFNENIRFYNVCPFGFGTDMVRRLNAGRSTSVRSIRCLVGGRSVVVHAWFVDFF